MLSKRYNRRDALKTMSAATAACFTVPGNVRADDSQKPNIVLIFVDDLGYGDLGCYGSKVIKTPRLDRMAAEGLQLNEFYSCACVCTPSRAGLLTGRYPVRSGLSSVLFPNSKVGIEDSEITIAQALQVCGYRTMCIGKWHLGHLPPHLPTRHGFDQYYGIPYSNDMEVKRRGDPPLPLMRDETIIEQPADQTTLTKRYTEEAIRFIEESKDGPFFLYLPHTFPHIPLFASKEFKGKSERGLYGDVVEEIDWSTGQILDALKRLGLDENTLVIFTSDNGPWLTEGENGGSAGLLRNGKGTVFEGGVREPCIMRWPGKISPGRVDNQPAITLDFFPTLARLAGTTVPHDRSMDGKDLRGLLFDTAASEPREFYFYRGQKLLAIRSGDWKLLKPFKGNVFGEILEYGTLLFNLKEDAGETTNLAGRHPDIVARLSSRMSNFENNLGPVPEEKN